jgi:hypothetical protein
METEKEKMKKKNRGCEQDLEAGTEADRQRKREERKEKRDKLEKMDWEAT